MNGDKKYTYPWAGESRVMFLFIELEELVNTFAFVFVFEYKT